MKKIQVTLVTLLLTGASLCAQTIGEKELNDIKGSFQKDASTKAIQNVLTMTRISGITPLIGRFKEK